VDETHFVFLRLGKRSFVVYEYMYLSVVSYVYTLSLSLFCFVSLLTFWYVYTLFLTSLLRERALARQKLKMDIFISRELLPGFGETGPAAIK